MQKRFSGLYATLALVVREKVGFMRYAHAGVMACFGFVTIRRILSGKKGRIMLRDSSCFT